MRVYRIITHPLKLATLYDIQTIYSVKDVYSMLEIIDAHEAIEDYRIKITNQSEG